MRFATLKEWLDWQETLHPRIMDLELGRVRAVAESLGVLRLPAPVVLVGGTNGKGSTVAMIAAIAGAAGYRVGTYTSPHLCRYNERIRLEGAPASDDAICEAFERVDRARGATTLTYFEFGTLAALDIFQRVRPDLVILEVGLGGRLDAVNIVEPDAALVTNVAMDHSEWLGGDRECIGREKAGIYRAGKPAICVERDPPASLSEYAAALDAGWMCLGEHFDFTTTDGQWRWHGGGAVLAQLPRPGLMGEHQLANAAGALAAVAALAAKLPVSETAIRQGLRTVHLEGRMERIPGDVEHVLDVAHNPHAATALARALAADPRATHAVVGMMSDKDVAGVIGALAREVDSWYFGGLPPPRGLSGPALAVRATDQVGGKPVSAHDSVEDAYREAIRGAGRGERILVCGSFLAVGPVGRLLAEDGLLPAAK